MTYWAMNAVFLAMVAVVAVVALAVQARRLSSGGSAGDRGMLRIALHRSGRPLAVTLVVMLVATAVFDNIMIGVGLVGYDESRISGAFIGIAPLEDFAYTVAAVVLLPSLWVLLGHRERASAALSDARTGASESTHASSGESTGEAGR